MRTIGVAALAAGVAVQPLTAAEPATSVVILDYASIPAAYLQRGIGELKNVFQAAGIQAVVSVERRARPGSADERPADDRTTVRVSLYPRLMDDRISDDPSILGVVPGADRGGRLAYVFPARVEVAAKRRQADYGTLLGVVMAHEIGHVLLRARAHSATGIMRPMCDSRQYRTAALGALSFTPAEAMVLRSRLENF